MSVVRKLHFKLSSMQIKSKFLNSCISEGLIPNGFRLRFNLAFNTKNINLSKNIENLLNENSSRTLDLVYSQCVEEVYELESAYELESERLRETVTNRRDWSRMMLECKRENADALEFKKKQLKRKLANLRNEKQAGQEQEICRRARSVRLSGFKYIKEEDSGFRKVAPFPRNLRPQRRNRPHREKRQPRSQFVASQEELS